MQLSEFEPVPCLVQVLQSTATRLSAWAQAQQDRFERSNVSVAIPAVFIGRFIERYKVTSAQHSEALDALNDAHSREQQARRRVDSFLEHPGQGTKEDELQKAQLSLCEAETNSDTAKHDEQVILRNIRRESRRIARVARHQLMVSCRVAS